MLLVLNVQPLEIQIVKTARRDTSWKTLPVQFVIVPALPVQLQLLLVRGAMIIIT